MSKAKYIAPSIELIQFGNEDLVCIVSGWTPDGKPGNGFGVKDETDETDGDF